MTLRILALLTAASTALQAAPTPAQEKITTALAAVEKSPEKASAYPPLAFAYAARAGETADGEFYSKGLEAAHKALGIEPDNYAAQKAEVWILLGQHEFQKGYKKAVALNKRNGDDPMVYALLNLAHAKAAQGKYEEAVKLHREHFAAASHPENRYELAAGLRKAGQDEEADKEFATFEKEALGESKSVDNANRELTAYYIDEAKNPQEALRIANLEMGNRQDYRTLYARALHASGKFQEAHTQMEKALAVGIKIPEMQAHAAIIAKDAGK